jgi:cytochrome b561
MPFRYALPARALHAVMALAIFAAFALAFWFDDMPLSRLKINLINYHKWIGVAVLALVVVRLAWRLTHRPQDPEGLKPWARTLAHLTHWALYGLMAWVPFVGWLMSSAKGYPVVWLGVLPLPDLVAKDPQLGHTLKEVHEWAAWALLALVVLHIAAALKHRFVDHDDVMNRMFGR